VNILIIYLGLFYIIIGIIFIFVPIFYLELGKPKDLIKAFLNLLIGCVFIIKNKSIDKSFSVIFFLLTTLIILYIIENFLSRWNQLTDKEKNKLITFSEFKKNLSKTLEAIKIGVVNFAKPLNFLKLASKNKEKKTKKWVRNDKNDNIKV